MKCSACRSYFAVSAPRDARPLDLQVSDVPFRSAVPRVRRDARDTSVPGGPAAPSTESGSDEFPALRKPLVVRAGACPLCGSNSIRPASPGPLESFVARLNTNDLYRCQTCNASFRRRNSLKLATLIVAFLGVIAALTYVGVSKFGHENTSKRSPRMPNKPLPATQPPVFR